MASAADLPIPIPSAVAATNWIGIAKTTGGVIATVASVLATAVVRLAGYLWTAATWLLSNTYSVAAWPVARLVALLRVVFSPVTYTVSYALLPLKAVLGFVGRLCPLYTYLGSAAFIGILAGLVVKLASDYIVGILSLDTDDDDKFYLKPKTTRSSYSTAPSTRTGSAGTGTGPAATDSTARLARRPKTEDDKSDIVQDDVWQWLEEFNPPQPTVATDDGSSPFADAPSLSPRPRPPGLLSLTILEESSSEGGP